jgi:hypothetical protein
VIVVVASRRDAAAPALLTARSQDDVRMLTARDLSTPGWRVLTTDPAASRAVVQGEVVPTSAITGVLTRLPAIVESELPMIVPADRAYAATEMTAFLAYWLSSLTCPVLNPPTASSLCGPNWRSERWVLTAARLGLPVSPRHRRTPAFGDDCSTAAYADPRARSADEIVTATVVGDRCIGVRDEVVAARAQMLARAAGVDLLSVHFSGPESGSRFLDAHPWVNLHDARTADAIGDYFHHGPARAAPKGAHDPAVGP